MSHDALAEFGQCHTARGTFTQTGGTQAADNMILVGDAGAAVGLYSVQGGSLSVGLLWMGISGGTATFDQSAGAVTMSNGFIVGNDGSSVATIDVTSG